MASSRELALLRDKVARARLAQAGMRLPTLEAQAKRRWRAKRTVWCVYCGSRIKSVSGRYERGLTCIKHRDLPELDPKYGGRTSEPVFAWRRAA